MLSEVHNVVGGSVHRRRRSARARRWVAVAVSPQEVCHCEATSEGCADEVVVIGKGEGKLVHETGN